MGIENIVESERRICVVQHSSIPLTSIDIGNISFINVIENIDRVIEFMRNITIGNNSNIGLMIMIGFRRENRRSIIANRYKRIGTAAWEINGCNNVFLLTF